MFGPNHPGNRGLAVPAPAPRPLLWPANCLPPSSLMALSPLFYQLGPLLKTKKMAIHTCIFHSFS